MGQLDLNQKVSLHANRALATELSTPVWVRAGFSLVASVTVFVWGLRLVFMTTELTWLSYVSIALIVLGIAGTIVATAAIARMESRWLRWLELGILVGTVMGFMVWAYLQVIVTPGYATDELAYNQYAATLLLRGIDPYAASMAPAFNRLFVSPDAYTYLLNGNPVTALSYPALSFLVYVPLQLLGVHQQAAEYTDIGFWVIAMIMAFFMVPKALRSAVVVLLSFSVYISYAVGGITDCVMLPFLFLVAFQWDRYTVSPRNRWWAPVSLGLAMAIKQTPWFLAPILLIGLWREGQMRGLSRRQIGRMLIQYVLTAFLSFMVVNLPFVIVNPVAWIRGIFTPLVSAMVPSGQGLVGLAVFNGIGGGDLHLWNDGSLLLLLGVWALCALDYKRWKPYLFLTPVVSFFFADRSFASYMIDLLPVFFIAITTTMQGAIAVDAAGQYVSRRRRVLSWLPVLPGIALLMIAIVLPAPLALVITGVSTTGQFATIDRLKVAVTNTSSRGVNPHFTIDNAGQYTTFWNVVTGPAQLQPKQTRTYTLQAPNAEAMPSIQGGFQVTAFTTGVPSVSESPSYVPSLWHAAIIPAAINAPVSVGQPVTLQVQVLNRVDSPVRQGSIPVYLGQVIYAQSGLEYAETKINNGNIGQTPVEALTNQEGIATFVIHASQANKNPVYFEANLVNSDLFYPYGYSNIVSVLFG